MDDRVLFVSGGIAAPAFVAGFSVGGRTTSGYDPRRQPISELSRESQGWRQAINFMLTGAAILAGAVGMRRRFRSQGEIARVGADGDVGRWDDRSGAFPTDTEAEIRARGLSWRGVAHVASSLPAFIAMPLSAGAVARYWQRAAAPGWAKVFNALAATSAVSALLMSVGFSSENPLTPKAGTIQRIAATAGLGGMSLFCFQLWAYPVSSRRPAMGTRPRV